jgi:general secretion pathway protein B
MVLGGAGCGWTVSQYPYLLALVHDWQQPSLVTQPTAVTVPSTSLTLEADIVGSGTNNISAVDLLVADTSRADSPGAAMPNAQQGLAKTPPALTPLAEPEPAPTSAPPRISADLLKRFNQALSEVTDTPASEPLADTSTNGVVPRVDKLPAWVLTDLPNLSFSAHMYASNDEQRWVRVNGIRMVEGDLIDNKVQIIQIAPQKVILTYAGQAFSMAALTDW